MLPPFIIDLIKRRKERRERSGEDRLRLPIPVPPSATEPEEEKDEGSERGVVIIDPSEGGDEDEGVVIVDL